MPGARYTFTHRRDGDFRVDRAPTALAELRQGIDGGTWTWLHQVHGADVVVVETPGQHAGSPADAAVTAHPGAVLSIHTADCAPVLFHDAAAGVVGAAHAGWRGLAHGVIEGTVDAMTTLGATSIRAIVGPHIRARCYEFGVTDLDGLAARYGDGVRATTGWGSPALDVSATIASALATCRAVVDVVTEPGCTACEPERFYSHRARRDPGRHAATIALEP